MSEPHITQEIPIITSELADDIATQHIAQEITVNPSILAPEISQTRHNKKTREEGSRRVLAGSIAVCATLGTIAGAIGGRESTPDEIVSAVEQTQNIYAAAGGFIGLLFGALSGVLVAMRIDRRIN